MLTGGVATIKVGGNSETEVRERIDRVEDAVNATRASLKNGVVAGGGIALLSAREVIKSLKFNNRAERLGAMTLYKVLATPSKKILENAELPQKSYGKYPNWIDVRTGFIGNFYAIGILDPVNVTTEALKNASSVCSTLLTADAYVLYQR
jgi:chaperonin GroEL